MANECCLGLIQAKHLNYDLFIHLGPACLSQNLADLPQIQYVFPKKITFDFPTIQQKIISSLEKLKQSPNEKVLILIDQDLQHVNLMILEIFLQNYDKNFIFSGFMPHNSKEILPDWKPLFLGYYSTFSASPETINSSPHIIFIGDQSSPFLLKIGLLLGKFPHKSFHFLCDSDTLHDNSSTFLNKEIMKRFALIEKSREKKIFGILINSPTLIQFQETFTRMKKLLKLHNKKFYTLMINNITEAKLGNFPEIEVFVILSCPNHSLYSEKDFYRILITPYELELALDSEKKWENSIVLDYNFGFKEEVIDKKDEVEINKEESLQMMLKNQNDKIQIREVFQTLDLFEQRTFKGLEFEQNVPVTLAIKGLRGIASEYEDEKERK